MAIVEEGGGWDAGSVYHDRRADGDGHVLDGTKSYVVDGHTADVLVVAAVDEAGELGFYLVDGDAPGVTRRLLVTLDMTRKQASVRLDGVHVGAGARLERGGAEVLADLYDLAAVALAFESVGGRRVGWTCRSPTPRSGSSSAGPSARSRR